MRNDQTITGVSIIRQKDINPKAFLFIILVFFLVRTSASGQESSNNPFYLSIAYSGNNIWNPGAKFSAEWLIHSKENSQEKLNTENQWMLESHVGFFSDPGSHFAGYTGVGINYRIKMKKQARLNLSLYPARIYRSFLPNTYQYESSEIQRIPLAGNTYFAPAAGIGFSKGFPKNPDNEIFTDIRLAFLLPYNTYVMPTINFEAGWRFAVKKK